MSTPIDWSWLIKTLDELSRRALRLVEHDAVDYLLPVALKEAQPPIDTRVPTGLLEVARRLVDAKSEELLDADARAALTPGRAIPGERQSEVHADVLAAIWLGLYFLGVPSNDPWERALRLVEGGGGLPHGAMINKAIGDVYRWARRALPRDFAINGLQPSDSEGHGAAPDSCFHPQGIYVLTRRPFALMPIREWPSARSITQSSFALLGRCYALLQLRLYVAAGLPISYVVPAEMMRELLRPAGACTSVANWMRRIVGPLSRAGQLVLISNDPKRTAGLPTCVLAHNRGVYTLEGIDDAGRGQLRSADDPLTEHGIAFAGNRVGSALAKAYRERLSRIEPQLLTWTEEEQDLMRRLQGLANQDNEPARA